MKSLWIVNGVVAAAVLLSGGELYAQSVTIAPSYPAVPVGTSVQLTAKVTGLSSTAVTWTVNGIVGGNSTIGTVSQSGLYTAPAAVPSQALVTAISKANTSIVGADYMNVESPGPTIVSVTPNPLLVGNFTVTITGTGFRSGARVIETYGTVGQVLLTTTSVTATTVTATGYQGPAPSASFVVQNTGSAPSNPVSVAVATGYPLKVKNGSGSGTYAAGAVVSIQANAPPAGEAFAGWTGAKVANSTAASTTLIMPAASTTVTATYTGVTYVLTVVNGTGSGNYAAGALVPITANAAPAGKVFSNWTGATVTSATSASTTIAMPAANTTVTANYVTSTTFQLTVVSGTGSGSYAAGAVVPITANAAPAGQVFSKWTGATVASANSASTSITMPSANTTVTATYVAAPTFTLTVVSGTGSGSYAAGAVVPITANAAPAGQVFSKWTGATVASATSASTSITMPAANTTVTATYVAATYTLTVVNGTGSGSYTAGTVVPIAANAAPAGQVFSTWTGATVASATSSSTTLTMPAANTTVTATYVPAPTYTLTVVSGTGSGSYAVGTVVPIAANAPPAGQSFINWTGATVANANFASTTLTMPAANTTVTANFGVSTNPPGSCGGMSTGANASLNGFLPFPSSNLWNTDISNAPLDPNNTAITSAAGFAGLHLHHDFSSVAGGNYGIPYVVVDSSSTPLVPVNVIDYASESDVAKEPLPLAAPIEGSPADCSGWPDTYVGDSHVLVVDRKACMLYETFNTHRCNGAWNSSSETIWDLRATEHRPWGWTSADAAGLPIFPGLLRYDEVAAGAVNHAIRFTMQHTKNDANGGYFVAPATHAAGTDWGVSNVMGMRIRLKASFDISGYSAANQVILTAMKKYGLILADNGGYFYFQGVPDPRWNDNDLVNLDSIQSSNFEVVQMTPTFPGYDSATAPTGQLPIINNFTASATTVASGTPVTLTWSTTNDTYDFIDQVGGVSAGSVTITPAATTTYTLNATNQSGRTTAQVTVTVH